MYFLFYVFFCFFTFYKWLFIILDLYFIYGYVYHAVRVVWSGLPLCILAPTMFYFSLSILWLKEYSSNLLICIYF